jgi:hypothetical protein
MPGLRFSIPHLGQVAQVFALYRIYDTRRKAMRKILRLFVHEGLMLLLALILFFQFFSTVAAHSPANTGPSPADSMANPVEVWSVHFSSSVTWADSNVYYGGRGLSTDSGEYYQNGSFFYNVYPDNSEDTTDFKMYVAFTRNYEEKYKYDDGVTELDILDYSITDPDKYMGDPQGLWEIYPYQDGNGSWSAYFWTPGVSFSYSLYHYYTHIYSDGTSDPQIDEVEPTGWISSCFTNPLLQGNADGTMFTYHTEGAYDSLFASHCNPPRDPPYESPTLRYSVDISAVLINANDLTVDHLEVTQGLQDDANSIPFVQGRRTVVRAFINTGVNPGPVPSVTGSLEVYAGGTKLGTVRPFNPGGEITAPRYPNWKNINDTLNFEIPPGWTRQPALTFYLKVNPDRALVETNYDNNDLTEEVNLNSCKRMTISYWPIHYEPPGRLGEDPSDNIRVGQAFIQKIYPLAENGLNYVPGGSLRLMENINTPGIEPDTFSKDVEFLNSLTSLFSISGPTRPDYVFGWLPPLAFDGNGLGNMPGNVAFGNDTETPDRWRRTFAHELGHNFGLDHPSEGGRPHLTTSGAHWFDVYERSIKPVPASVGGKNLLDFMEPARLELEAWISPLNYRYLFNQLCPAPAGVGSAGSSLQTAGDNLIVSGIIGKTMPPTGKLNPLIHLSTVMSTTIPEGSQYCIQLKDTSGDLLKAYCFNQSFEGDTITPTSEAPFSLVVPYPAGLHQVDLVENHEPTVLFSRVASAHAPSINVTSPNPAGMTLNGAETITWSGSDVDLDPLTYTILYSPDNGTTWIGVGANITATSYTLDFASLPGTDGASGLVKVLATDGFYTAQDTSDNPFTVGNKAPLAAILSPSTGASVYLGPQIVLEASGVDFEDGSLSDSAFGWSSSLDGALGTGQVLETGLSVGEHTLSLTVTDSDGLTDTAAIQVTVLEGPVEPTYHYLYLPLVIR